MCEGLRLRKTNRQDRHIKTEKHRKGVEGGRVDGKTGGDMVGAEGGQNPPSEIHTTIGLAKDFLKL